MRAHLDDFGHAVGEFALRKSFEERGVDKDVFWLPEGSDEVLSMWGIDGCLSADAGVDHGQQSGWDLNEADTTHTENIIVSEIIDR